MDNCARQADHSFEVLSKDIVFVNERGKSDRIPQSSKSDSSEEEADRFPNVLSAEAGK